MHQPHLCVLPVFPVFVERVAAAAPRRLADFAVFFVARAVAVFVLAGIALPFRAVTVRPKPLLLHLNNVIVVGHGFPYLSYVLL